MNIRTATLLDLAAITAVEAECFPAEEAATEEVFAARLQVYPNHFWLLEDNGKLVSFINGMVINELTIRDEMFENALLHDENGKWQTLFGVNTIPEYRKQGLATKLIKQVIQDAQSQQRKGCILTCKQELLTYYEKFGFKSLGISASTHGGAVWYDMQLEFQ